MNALEWLKEKAPGFSLLEPEELTEIMHFSFLWSLFENKVLKKNGSSKKILSVVHEWHAKNKLELTNFEEALHYFKQRYSQDDEQGKSRFQALYLRGNDNPELVKAVLSGEKDDPADQVSVLLIIVYRFRNNLFHGTKWDYELKGQKENFQHANRALMQALETHENI
jgi:hypothetical protein